MSWSGRHAGLAALAALLAVQACDGVLTYLGIAAFGPEVERNPVVFWYVAKLGPGYALVAIKSVGWLCAVLLYWRSMYWVMAALTLFYVAVGLVPWTQVLWP